MQAVLLNTVYGQKSLRNTGFVHATVEHDLHVIPLNIATRAMSSEQSLLAFLESTV